MRFVLLPGQRHDSVGAAALIEGVKFDGLIADKAFDSDTLIAELTGRGAKIAVSQKAPLDIDPEIYTWRHPVENFFCKLKEFRRIAMRSDKTDTSFEAMIYLAAGLINSR